MKQIIKQRYSILWLLGIIFLLASCEKGPNFEMFSYPAQTVTGMSPNSGFPGIDMTITGKNFGTITGAVKVYFGGILADTVRSCTDNQIVVKVPNKAISGKVSLKIWLTSNDSIGTFTVIPPPVITAVSTGAAAPGDVITITGTGFGTDISKLSVGINGTPVTINSVTGGTTITATVPASFSSGIITLTLSGYSITGPSLVYLVGVPAPVYQLDFENNLNATIGANATYIKGNAQSLSYIQGISGQAVSMAGYFVTDGGIHQAIALPANTARYNEMTISCWVNHPGTAIPGSTHGWWEAVWDLGTGPWSTAPVSQVLSLYAARNGWATTGSDMNITAQFRCEKKSAPTYGWTDIVAVTTQSIPKTGWHHLAMTVSKTSSKAFTYLDGVLIGTMVLPANFDLVNSNQIYDFIGANADGGNNNCYLGGIDKFQIFNSVLNADQINTLVYKK